MDIIDNAAMQQQTALCTMSDPVLTSLEQYWRTLRHARHIPMRNDLNPSKIDFVLPYAFILQRVAPGTARFRVAGQRLHDVLKMDARGMPFSTLFHPDAREDIGDFIETAFGEPAILGLPLVTESALLRAKQHSAMILLPMQDDHGQTNRLLGALVTSGSEQTRPQRFKINSQVPLRHESLGLALVTTRLKPRSPAPSKRPDASLQPALRLVVNNG